MTTFDPAEYCHIFFKSLRMVCYWACGDMVLDILHKAERDADLDIWEDAQEKWMRFERFLWLLRYMPFSKKPLWLWIVDINNDKHAAIKLPDLHDLGQVAFRSQVEPYPCLLSVCQHNFWTSISAILVCICTCSAALLAIFDE